MYIHVSFLRQGGRFVVHLCVCVLAKTGLNNHGSARVEAQETLIAASRIGARLR